MKIVSRLEIQSDINSKEEITKNPTFKKKIGAIFTFIGINWKIRRQFIMKNDLIFEKKRGL